jgi:hypothetical protein
MRLHMTTRRGKLEKPDLHNIAAGPNTTLSWPSQGRFFGDELVTQLLQNSNFYLLAVVAAINKAPAAASAHALLFSFTLLKDYSRRGRRVLPSHVPEKKQPQQECYMTNFECNAIKKTP